LTSPPLVPVEVRTVEDLKTCHALIIPGGESTTIALVAEREGLLEPLRDFVRFVPDKC
jgi:5'-phosphate synthase pdxT subunit